MTLTDDQATRLHAARRNAGLTQHELAQKLGIATRTVHRCERGATHSRAITLAWALACSVDADWLDTGRDPNWMQ